MPTPSVAALSGVSLGYRGHRVVDGLDLTVPPGVTGLLGPNGAGKTTLFRTLSTMVPAQAGAVELFGRPVDDERSARAARRRIGYLPQEFGYYPNFSVAEFVRYCAWLREVPSKSTREAVRQALATVSLTDRARQRMKSLSGGMLRRAGIASAIVGAPELILLDEPTVGLDPAQRLEFREVLRSLAREGAAIVLSTHLVEDVQAVCDTVVVLHDGAVRYRGTPERLAADATPEAPGDSPLERGYMSVLHANSATAGETC